LLAADVNMACAEDVDINAEAATGQASTAAKKKRDQIASSLMT